MDDRGWQIHTFILRLLTYYLLSEMFPLLNLGRGESEDTVFCLSHLFSSRTCLLSWNYFKEVLPTSQLPFMWDKAQVCANSCKRDTLETGLSDRAEGEAWRCSRRVPWKGREILPAADSDGANSSTKDRQTRGQPALYLAFLELALSSSASFPPCGDLFLSQSPITLPSFFFLSLFLARLMVTDMTDKVFKPAFIDFLFNFWTSESSCSQGKITIKGTSVVRVA